MNFTEHYLQEVLITFGGKAYPKFGNVVIMAGGAGSGKGFVISNLLGIEGKIFDVDRTKELILKSKEFLSTYPELKTIDMKNSEDANKMHQFMVNYKWNDKFIETFFKQLASTKDLSMLPNLIFDVSLKNVDKLKETNEFLNNFYDKRNVHIVWVVNDIDWAKIQNMSRNRIVMTDILVNTHEGSTNTMLDIINGSINVQEYMDGDIWIDFNLKDIDVKIKSSDLPSHTSGVTKTNIPKKGSYIIRKADQEKINKSNKILSPDERETFIFKIKEQDKPIDKSTVTKDILNRIFLYQNRIKDLT